MSYSISYGQEARWLPIKTATGDEKLVFLLEDIGDNNVWTVGGKSRAHRWICVDVHTENYAWLAMREVVQRAASCCGGSLKFYGSSRYVRPEAYIGRWRRAIANAAPLLRRDAEPLEPGRSYRMSVPEDKKTWDTWHRADRFSLGLRIDFPIVEGKVAPHEPEAAVRKALLENHPDVPHAQVAWSYGDGLVERWCFDVKNEEEAAVWWKYRFRNQPTWSSVKVLRGPELRNGRYS